MSMQLLVPRRRQRVSPVKLRAAVKPIWVLVAAAALTVIVTQIPTADAAHRLPRGHRLGQPAATAHQSSGPVTLLVSGMRVVSYYPSRHPWGGMWSVWEPSVIDADMARIASLGANTVRVFVQPATFGYPAPQATYVSRLKQLLSIAVAHGLRVYLNLFDGWSAYTDLARSQLWAGELLRPFRGDPRIACVELQNEIDPTNPQAMAWAREMLPVVHADSGRPVTVSVNGWNSAAPLGQLIKALGSSQPSFYDLHFYGTPRYMYSTFRTAKRLVAGRPLLIGETGYSTALNNTSWLGSAASVSVQDWAQARYFADAERAAWAAGLPAVGVWNLNDFTPRTRVSAVEQHFGLYRVDGTPKPAAAVVARAFRKYRSTA